MTRRFLTGILILASAILLTACAGIPSWVLDTGAAPSAQTPEAYPARPTVSVTATPIDAVEGLSPLARPQSTAVWTAPTAVPTTRPLSSEAPGKICSDTYTGNSLTYQSALARAQESDCADAGDLLAAHLCNPNTGTWWLSLSTRQEGCNPACVVDVNTGLAEVNWRCAGGIVPAVEGSQAGQEAPPNDSPDSRFGKFAGWQGLIFRQPHGSLVAYKFLRDDGQWFDIGAPENEIRQLFTAAAWTASQVILSGELTAVPGVVSVEEMVTLPARTREARNLSPFALTTSSSDLVGDIGGAYYGWSAVDGQLSRPWCEGVDGPGTGEWLQFDFSAPLEITAIKVANGFDAEDYLYEINNRVRTLTLILDGETWGDWELLDTRGLQSLELSGGVVPAMVTNSVRLEIGETIAGWEFDDTCISELEIWGRPVE